MQQRRARTPVSSDARAHLAVVEQNLHAAPAKSAHATTVDEAMLLVLVSRTHSLEDRQANGFCACSLQSPEVRQSTGGWWRRRPDAGIGAKTCQRDAKEKP